jgi:hypothetical protein
MVRGSGGRLNSAGGFPIRIATACSYCARATPTSIASARVVRSWVFDCSTSTSEVIPPWNLLSFNSKAAR